MLPLVWTDEATTDLLDILDYIAERNVAPSDRIERAVRHVADRMPDHPYMHRFGRVLGTREAIVHPNYIPTTSLCPHVAEVIEIAAVLHARQQYP